VHRIRSLKRFRERALAADFVCLELYGMVMRFSLHTRRIRAYPGVLVLVAECGVFQRRSAQGGAGGR